MTASEWAMKYLPPLGRHAYLDRAAIQCLMRSLLPGLKIASHIERRGDAWRLRMSYTDESGKRIRRGITLPDADTTAWVRDYIQKVKGTESGNNTESYPA